MYFTTEQAAILLEKSQRTVQNACVKLNFEKTGKIYIIDANKLKQLKNEISCVGAKKKNKKT